MNRPNRNMSGIEISFFLSACQDLQGVYSARAFVGWYNGLPIHKDVINIC